MDALSDQIAIDLIVLCSKWISFSSTLYWFVANGIYMVLPNAYIAVTSRELPGSQISPQH